jgi:hypothetical protein
VSKDFNTDTAPEKKASPATGQEDWEERLCAMVGSEWSKGRSYVSKLNDLHDDIYDMLRGERPKKNYDWQSNVVINKVFQIVWTTISYVAQKIYKANPIVGIDGFDERECWKRQMLIEKWFQRDQYFITLVLIWLRLILNGTVFVKKTWNQELITAPGGRKFPKQDGPHDMVVDNADVVIDWLLRPGQSIKDARFIIHREMVDLASLYSSKVNYINLDLLQGTTGVRTDNDENKPAALSKDGLDQPPASDVYREVEVKERQGFFPVSINKNGDIKAVFEIDEIYGKDRDEKIEWRPMVITIARAGGAPVLIRWEENPYGEMTWCAGHLFLDAKKWWSTGQIEPIADLQTMMNDNVNAMFDEIWRNLTPPILVNKYGLHEWDTMVNAPGQIWQIAGPPRDQIEITRPSQITGDAWMKHRLFDNEIQLSSSVTPDVSGKSIADTATQGVLNSQFSSAKFDLMIMLFEQSLLIPSVEMTFRFAQKFAHPMTFLAMFGEPMKFDDPFVEGFKYQPRLSSVKTDQSQEREVQEDIQLLGIVAPMQNPGTAKMVNVLIQDIMMQRKGVLPAKEQLLDENYFEPSTPEGTLQMMNRGAGGIQPGAPSNQNGIPQSVNERSIRQRQITPKGMNLQ